MGRQESFPELQLAIGALRHSDALIQVDLARFRTDCSTPTFQLAKNAVKRIEALERAIVDAIKDLDSERHPAQGRHPVAVKLSRVHGET